MDPFLFPKADEFLNRERELAEMEAWWGSNDLNSLMLFGRRRVGKSWLFRRFAHKKPALVLVGERIPPGAQLERISEELAPYFGGANPKIDDVPTLFRLLLTLGEREKYLAVIDELPYLLPSSEQAREQTLTGIQAVLEERDRSEARFVLCGSHIAVMEGLMRASSGLSGRLRPLQIQPMGLKESQCFIRDRDPVVRIKRYAVTGGMPRSLSLLGQGGSLKELACRFVLNPNGPLFNEPRDVLERELRQSDNYFGLLQALSTKRELSPNNLAGAVKKNETSLPPFLRTLQEMKLIERKIPFGASRKTHGLYRLSDPFLRFWFRYVFPFQESLSTGLEPESLWDNQVESSLSEHVSWAFEELCRRWILVKQGHIAPIVSSWWGSSPPVRNQQRQSEEIDIVGGVNKTVTVLGECKWTNTAMDIQTLFAIREHKQPALSYARLKVVEPKIFLFSRSGFSKKLVDISKSDDSVELIGVKRLVEDLLIG